MNAEIQSFLELKESIREATTQYRQKDDTSESLFHPSKGFVYGYDITATDAALRAYESTIPSEYDAGIHTLTVAQKLLIQAQELSETHPIMEVRDFAREVAAYMLMNVPITRRIKLNPLKKLQLVSSLPEQDVIDD